MDPAREPATARVPQVQKPLLERAKEEERNQMTVDEGQAQDATKAQILHKILSPGKVADWPPFPEIKTAVSNLQQAQASVDDWRRIRLTEAAHWIREGAPGRALQVIGLLLESYEQ